MKPPVVTRCSSRRRVLLWVVVPALTVFGGGQLLSRHLAINLSRSLPGLVYWLEPGVAPRCGTDVMILRVPRGARHFAGERLMKRAAGCPGDMVVHDGRDVYLNGEFMGRAKERSRAGEPLKLGPAGPVPFGHYFAAAPHPDSYDSRYGDLGFVPEAWVNGRARRLF